MVMGLAGCMSVSSGPDAGGPSQNHGGMAPPAVAGVQGPWGQNVAMAAPYSAAPRPGAMAAQAMFSQSVPLDLVQMAGMSQGGLLPASFPGAPPGALPPPMVTPPGGAISPPGVPFAPGIPAPGMGQGNGVINADLRQGPAGEDGLVQAQYPPGAVAAIGAIAGQIRFPVSRTQVRFVRPSGMKVSWYTVGSDGKPTYSDTPINTPGRYNFLQAAIYRLKLSNIEGRPGLEVYPTLEVVPANPKTEAFLSHASVPLEFTNEDFKQITEGNYVVKVIYLPDPQFQELAGTGTEEILSTRLEPGADPIAEALRRGSILLVVRMGNMDQEAPNTPPLNAPGPNAQGPNMGIGGMGQGMPPPGMPPYGTMVPYFGAAGMPGGSRIPSPFQVGPPPNFMQGAGPGGPMMPPGAMAGPNGPMMPPGAMMGPNGPMMPPGAMSGPGGPMMPPGGLAGPNGTTRPPFGPPGPFGVPGYPQVRPSVPTAPTGPELGPRPTPNGAIGPAPGLNGQRGFPPNNAGAQPVGPPPPIRDVPPGVSGSSRLDNQGPSPDMTPGIGPNLSRLPSSTKISDPPSLPK
jgi:hypothetical protein